MDPSSVTQFVALVIMIALSGFFSSAETALTTINKIHIRSLAEDGNKRAQTVLDITEDSGKLLSAILIGNNIVNLSAASLTTTLAYKLGGSAVAIGNAIITVLILLFGEITPKTMATLKADRMAMTYANFFKVYIKLMTPLIFLINKLSLAVLFLLRIDPKAENRTMTENELRTIVDVSHEDGVIESEEKEMIYNVVDLGDARAKDVMVPRVNVTFASSDSTYEELIQLFREDKFTRLPVYEGTKDNVVGTINIKDLLLFDRVDTFQISDILREPYFTYEYKNISELLVEMRQASFNIAIVLDEYGETSGLITLEDILEEIVGEIHDEYDENEDEVIRKIGDSEYLIEGSVSLDDVNDTLDLDTFHIELTSEDYDSIGGLIIEHLDRLPECGDEIMTESQIRMVVEKLDKNRIELVHVYLPELPSLEASEEEPDSEAS